MINFKLNEVEEANFRKWLDEHNKICRCFNPTPEDLKELKSLGTPYTKPFGVGMTGRPIIWKFTQDTIGYNVEVECVCGAKADLTDYDSF
jgi:hypothetical protein